MGVNVNVNLLLRLDPLNYPGERPQLQPISVCLGSEEVATCDALWRVGRAVRCAMRCAMASARIGDIKSVNRMRHESGDVYRNSLMITNQHLFTAIR